MTYPRYDYLRTWPPEKHIALLEDRLARENATVRRIAGHWLRAADRVRELEKKVVELEKMLEGCGDE